MKSNFISINLKLVGSRCNLNCSYCYEHQQYGNVNTGIIKVDDIITYIDKTRKNFDYIKIILHGGEPLLYPKQDMKTLLENYKDNSKIDISIQTNGLLIDQEWIDIFKNYSKDFLFSISLDSKKSLLRNFKTEKLFKILKLIKKNNLKIGIISVISKENLDIKLYKEFINMLLEEFNIDFLTINKIRYYQNSKKYYINEIEYTKFLIQIFSYWIKTKLYTKLKINPFLDIMQSKHSCAFNNDLHKCNYFVSIYPPFKITGCDHKIGQSKDISKCLNCEIFDFCGGGCLYEKQDESFCEARFLLSDFIQNLINK